MKRKVVGAVLFILIVIAIAFATHAQISAQELVPRAYLPLVAKNYPYLVPDPAPGDWRWVVIAGDWGQDEQAAKDWALAHLTGYEWQTAYWPVYPCPAPPEFCPLYYRLIIGRWDTRAEAEEWAALQLPASMPWQTGYMYSRWTEGWWWEYE